MVKAVIFDFDGTLADFRDTDIECLELILKKTGANIPPGDFIDRTIEHTTSFFNLVESDRIDPLTLHRYRLSSTFKDFGIPWDDSYIDEYKEFLLERTEPYPGIMDLLAGIIGRVKLGLLTNAYDPIMQMRRIRAAGLAEYFDEIQISGEEKYSKPDPRAFWTIAEKLGVQPEECILIGDSMKYDIEGALAAGMQAILVQMEKEQALDSSAKSIEEVKLILKEMIV